MYNCIYRDFERTLLYCVIDTSAAVGSQDDTLHCEDRGGGDVTSHQYSAGGGRVYCEEESQPGHYSHLVIKLIVITSEFDIR